MTTDVEAILARARERSERRAAASPRPDYTAANAAGRRQKAALTRAIHSGNAEKVVLACRDVVREWSQPPFDGAWPDDWSRWQRALDDALGFGAGIDLRDLT